MTAKSLFLVLLLPLAVTASRADAPIYHIKLSSTKTFEVPAGAALNLYGLSASMVEGMRTRSERKVVAADYQIGTVIRTKEPATALQQVLGQISRQTGLQLITQFNSNLTQIAPTTLLQAYSATASLTLVLTPKGEDAFVLTCAYLLDERPPGSIDGTPAAIGQMEETERRMNADSIATSLPERIAANELKPGDYFRGAQKIHLSNPAGNKQTPVLVLLLKKHDDYTAGLYRDDAGTWVMMDEPVEFHQTGSPYPSGRSDQQRALMSLHAVRLDSAGGVDLYVDNGHVIQQPFAK